VGKGKAIKESGTEQREERENEGVIQRSNYARTSRTMVLAQQKKKGREKQDDGLEKEGKTLPGGESPKKGGFPFGRNGVCPVI